MPPVALFPAVILFALLARAVVTDLRDRTIGNGLNAAVALLAPAWWWAYGLPAAAIAWQVAAAFVLLLLFAGLFALRAMGGGDVKLIAAVALWLPQVLLLSMLWWMAVGGGVLTGAMLVGRRLRPRTDPVEVPYGVAIAGATIGVMANHILTTLAA